MIDIIHPCFSHSVDSTFWRSNQRHEWNMNINSERGDQKTRISSVKGHERDWSLQNSTHHTVLSIHEFSHVAEIHKQKESSKEEEKWRLTERKMDDIMRDLGEEYAGVTRKKKRRRRNNRRRRRNETGGWNSQKKVRQMTMMTMMTHWYRFFHISFFFGCFKFTTTSIVVEKSIFSNFDFIFKSFPLLYIFLRKNWRWLNKTRSKKEKLARENNKEEKQGKDFFFLFFSSKEYKGKQKKSAKKRHTQQN